MARPQLTIEPVTRDNWRDSLALAVRPDQQRFVADYAPVALVILAKAHVGAGGMHWDTYLFRSSGKPVGMAAVACSDREAAPDCWLFHFFVDEAVQGQGIGAAALTELLALVRRERPASRRLMLTVHPENLAAQRLYEHHGFAASGDVQDGEPVYALDLPAS
jgi:diamine N-acetyltransferase